MFRARVSGRFWSAAALVAVGCLYGSVAQAEQFIVTDVSYTHSKDTTTDSHYRVAPLPGSPSNWKSPVDYAAGSVRVSLEVKTKPTDTATKFQICFEGSPGYGCTDQSPTYTKTGTYEWTTKFSSFYLGNGGPDWSKGVSKVALILKDTNNNKPQGDAKYVPTDLHVQVAILSSGATFAPPVQPIKDAGVGDPPARPIAPPIVPDAGASTDAGAGAPQPPRDAATGTGGGSKDAATSLPAKDSGSSTSADDAGKDAGGARADAGSASAPKPAKDEGCSVGARSLSGGAPLVLSLAMLAVASRRRRRNAQQAVRA